jgi:hypothetical protein
MEKKVPKMGKSWHKNYYLYYFCQNDIDKAVGKLSDKVKTKAKIFSYGYLSGKSSTIENEAETVVGTFWAFYIL